MYSVDNKLNTYKTRAKKIKSMLMHEKEMEFRESLALA